MTMDITNYSKNEIIFKVDLNESKINHTFVW